MKKIFIFIAALLPIAATIKAQVEPGARKWKTWFITSGKDYRLAAPQSYKNEIEEIVTRQKNLDSVGWATNTVLECRRAQLSLAQHDG